MSRIFLVWLMFCACAFAAHAADDKKPAVFLSDAEVAKNAPTIARIEAYLSRQSTIISDFTQVAPDGSVATGKFYLQRPGKMRWQYNPPTPVLIVANGNELVYYDYELQQVTYIPISGSLVSFLARDPIRFSGEVGITTFESQATAVRIEVAQRNKPDEGRLMLEFSDVPLQLKSMIVTDATGQTTTVALSNAKYGAKIEPELFVFKDPRKRIRK